MYVGTDGTDGLARLLISSHLSSKRFLFSPLSGRTVQHPEPVKIVLLRGLIHGAARTRFVAASFTA